MKDERGRKGKRTLANEVTSSDKWRCLCSGFSCCNHPILFQKLISQLAMAVWHFV